MIFLENENQIKEIINDEKIKTVQLVMGDNEEELCMVVGTRMFSSPYLIPYDKKDFICDELRNTEIKIFIFTDVELTEGWKQFYIDGGIEEERWDRRTVFHPYDDMNEMFCIDEFLLEEILGISYHQDHIPNWKVGMIEWYRKHMIH